MAHIIEIRDTSNGVSERKPAHKVTKHLCVAYSNVNYDHTSKIYSIQGQCPAIPHRFEKYEDAVAVAAYLEHIFGDYWAIHEAEDWRGISIPQVAQYSVSNGERTFVALLSLEDCDTITLGDFQRALEKAKNGSG